MDNINYEILNLLQLDSRITYTQISREINLSIPSVKERIEDMLEKGIIKRNTIEIDYGKLKKPVQAFVTVDIHKNRFEHFQNFCKKNPHIIKFYRTVGPYNAIIYIAIDDTGKLEELIDNIKKYGTCLTSIITSVCFTNKKISKEDL